MGRRGLRRPTGRTLFLAVLLVVLAVYTQMAFDMEWRTVAGRIGAGFFPRIIGILALAITAYALVVSLLPGAVDGEDELGGEEEAGAADLGRHPLPMLVVIGLAALVVIVFIPLGMIVASALFLAAVLFLLNRGRPVMNVVLSLAVPVAVYLLFQTLLNAGLPGGILPRF
ncbi:tripartite tricarboxylate transporter TctB family protein [Blastococcus xanthinilyticus]|uniref:Tripartite tricarboxylate transporter TctB family protein n=1 Tax=Blastococcus xanthinilyticus TaxID=1564164 RepID=A0A5S5CPA7_9ACTN|nr:tripartite tricarboxylate transporter TctB family protein [Blastococcus xanthinilyticus]